MALGRLYVLMSVELLVVDAAIAQLDGDEFALSAPTTTL